MQITLNRDKFPATHEVLKNLEGRLRSEKAKRLLEQACKDLIEGGEVVRRSVESRTEPESAVSLVSMGLRNSLTNFE